jgi:hypothetical protein
MSLFQRSGLGVALDKALSPNAERKDQLAAERARRIMQSDAWSQDFFPLICKLHDAWLEKVKEGKAHIDALKSLDDLVTAIDGSVQLGSGAMKRIAERRLKAAEISKSVKESLA